MKNKTKVGIVGLFALSAAAIVMAVSNVPASAVRAEGEKETKVTGVVNNAKFFGENKAAMFTIQDAPDFGAWYDTKTSPSASVSPAPTLVNAFGETVKTNGIFPYGNHIIFAYGNVNQYGNIVSFAKDAILTSSAAGSYKFSEGSTWICKIPNGESGSWVPFIEPNAVTVPEASIDLGVAKTYQISASVDTTEENPLVFYKSGDNNVAEVSADGVITAKAVGKTTVSVYSGLKHAEIELTVKEGATLTSFALKDQTAVTLNQGDDWRMAIKGKVGVKTYSDGSTVEVEVKEDMCDATGYDAEKLGEQSVKVTCDGKEASLKINVVAIPELVMNEQNVLVADATGWGGYSLIFGSVADRSQYLNISKELISVLAEHILLNGSPMQFRWVKNLGGARYILNTDQVLKQGDVVELKKGLRLWQYSGTADGNHDPKGDGYYTAVGELKQDYKYVVTNQASSVQDVKFGTWEADPTGFELEVPATEMFVNETMKVNWTISSPEGKKAYGTPSFLSKNEDIATVDQNGTVIGKAIGTATIEATLRCGSEEVKKSFTVNVQAEKTRTGVVFSDAWKVYSFIKGSDASDFAPSLTKAKYTYEDGSMSAEFPIVESDVVTIGKVDTSVVGKFEIPVTFKRGELTLNGSIQAEVYEPIEEKVKQVAIVDWFDYCTFIQCGNTCANRANYTNDKAYDAQMKEMISYRRADGTPVELNTVYQLGANIAIFPKFLYDETGKKIINAENYNQLYQHGDTITIAKKTPLYTWSGEIEDPGNRNAPIAGTGAWIVEGYIEEELIYRYGESGWVRYIETTELTAKADAITINVGKAALANITRGPSGANSGTLVFTSDHPEIAKVNEKTGVIQGLKAGTAVITGTWTSEDGKRTLTKSITVTVVDALASLKADAAVELTQGEDLDLSALHIKAVYGSKAEKDVDVSKIVVTGFDKDKVGEQTVTLSYEENGVTVKTTVKVTVKEAPKSGCGGAIIGSSVVAGVALIGIAAIAIKRKKEDK